MPFPCFFLGPSPATSVSLSWPSQTQTTVLNRKLLKFSLMSYLRILSIHLSRDCDCSTKPPNSKQTETLQKHGCLNTAIANETAAAGGNEKTGREDRNQQIHQHININIIHQHSSCFKVNDYSKATRGAFPTGHTELSEDRKERRNEVRPSTSFVQVYMHHVNMKSLNSGV